MLKRELEAEIVALKKELRRHKRESNKYRQRLFFYNITVRASLKLFANNIEKYQCK